LTFISACRFDELDKSWATGKWLLAELTEGIKLGPEELLIINLSMEKITNDKRKQSSNRNYRIMNID
jgi:hypothetical protein